MIDQLTIGDKSSFDDFSASMAARSIHLPKKKSIKETVPFSNITYDFSAINGEIYWEERELEYIFEIIALSPDQLEEAKSAFADWVMNVVNEQLFDPFIPDYHFIVTFNDMDFDDEEGMDKTTATVKFTAYPYMISNNAEIYEIELTSGQVKNVTIVNNSSHKITPTIIVNTGQIKLTIDNVTFATGAGEIKDEALKLPVGTKTILVQNTGTTNCSVIISFYEEVF